MKMKKTEAMSLLIVVLSLLTGVFSLENVYGALNWIIPASSMQGQEIFLILPAMVLVYLGLAWFVARAIWHLLVAIVFAVHANKKGGN